MEGMAEMGPGPRELLLHVPYPECKLSRGARVKNTPVSAGDERDMGAVLVSGRAPGGGNGSPLQYSCLQNPTDRGVWRATVHRVAQSQTQLKQLGTQHT